MEGIVKTPPAQQRMERKESLAEEHKAALMRAMTLNVPHAVAPQEEFDGAAEETAAPPKGKPNWDQLAAKLLDKSPAGGLTLKEGIFTT